MGRDVQEETVLWRELYFVVCSVVRVGAVGIVADLEGWEKVVLRTPERSSGSTIDVVEEEGRVVSMVEAIFSGVFVGASGGIGVSVIVAIGKNRKRLVGKKGAGSG